MKINTIILIIFSTAVIFSQPNPFPKYNYEAENNEIDLIVNYPDTMKNKSINELKTHSVQKRISDVIRIDSENDSGISVWNGKSNYIDLRRLNSIQIKKSSYGFLYGSLAGFGIGLLTGLIINGINSSDNNPNSDPNNPNPWSGLRGLSEGINAMVLGILIGTAAGGLLGLIADIATDEYSKFPLHDLSDAQKKYEIMKHLRGK